MQERKNFIIRQGIIFVILTLFFSGVVFFLRSYFFSNDFSEPHLHETSSTSSGSQEEIFSPDENISGLLDQHFHSAAPYNFYYFPNDFEELGKSKSQLFAKFLDASFIKKATFGLNIQIHKEKYDVRGKMKNKSIKMYGVGELSSEEFLSVAIHEFAHYVDIYYYQKKVLQDLSENFYTLSWKDTKVIKPGQEQKDFVSGYAMTNMYEDFSESFTYYIIHNNDFLEKAKKSEILQKKYNFFSIYFFKKDEFKNTDFSLDNEILDYYRDITKIEYDLEKLLQYLEKGI